MLWFVAACHKQQVFVCLSWPQDSSLERFFDVSSSNIVTAERVGVASIVARLLSFILSLLQPLGVFMSQQEQKNNLRVNSPNKQQLFSVGGFSSARHIFHLSLTCLETWWAACSLLNVNVSATEPGNHQQDPQHALDTLRSCFIRACYITTHLMVEWWLSFNNKYQLVHPSRTVRKNCTAGDKKVFSNFIHSNLSFDLSSVNWKVKVWYWTKTAQASKPPSLWFIFDTSNYFLDWKWFIMGFFFFKLNPSLNYSTSDLMVEWRLNFNDKNSLIYCWGQKCPVKTTAVKTYQINIQRLFNSHLSRSKIQLLDYFYFNYLYFNYLYFKCRFLKSCNPLLKMTFQYKK